MSSDGRSLADELMAERQEEALEEASGGDIVIRLWAEVDVCPGVDTDSHGLSHGVDCCFGTLITASSPEEGRIMTVCRDAAEEIELLRDDCFEQAKLVTLFADRWERDRVEDADSISVLAVELADWQRTVKVLETVVDVLRRDVQHARAEIGHHVRSVVERDAKLELLRAAGDRLAAYRTEKAVEEWREVRGEYY